MKIIKDEELTKEEIEKINKALVRSEDDFIIVEKFHLI